ncbi:MAG: hypothetical protein EOO11_22080, partial [Chitinophagaceae bacterium]
VRSNALKSILTLHDAKRLVRDSESQPITLLLAQAVKGGFPCFEKNLPIEDANEQRYFLNYPRAGRVEVMHNMKWSTQDTENSYKTAYLGSLLLHVYAQLFEEGHRPATLKWSYPSAMSAKLVGQYEQIWSKLDEISPLKDDPRLTIYNPSGTITYSTTNPQAVFGTGDSTDWSQAAAAAPAPAPNWGWGNTEPDPAPAPAAVGGWGAPTSAPAALREIKIETGPIEFSFKNLENKESLTEACAVANYIANSKNIEVSEEFLTLCFDVGGSTTDFMALCRMNTKLTMVKQSSIRFAAQRVAHATKYSPNFKTVLLEMCDIKKISIQGLNKGESKFTANTAPYYFEQLVDRLEPEDFETFYRLIRSKCPELMSVNLYVTGLIMYYAGQMANKLITELSRSSHSPSSSGEWRPKINIVFAG